MFPRVSGYKRTVTLRRTILWRLGYRRLSHLKETPTFDAKKLQFEMTNFSVRRGILSLKFSYQKINVKLTVVITPLGRCTRPG